MNGSGNLPIKKGKLPSEITLDEPDHLFVGGVIDVATTPSRQMRLGLKIIFPR
jgi:hypothetical protein